MQVTSETAVAIPLSFLMCSKYKQLFMSLPLSIHYPCFQICSVHFAILSLSHVKCFCPILFKIASILVIGDYQYEFKYTLPSPLFSL